MSLGHKLWLLRIRTYERTRTYSGHHVHGHVKSELVIERRELELQADVVHNPRVFIVIARAVVCLSVQDVSIKQVSSFKFSYTR